MANSADRPSSLDQGDGRRRNPSCDATPSVIPEASLSSTRLGRLKIPDSVDLNADLVRVWESHWFRLAVAREFTGDQEFDANAVLGVPQVLAAREGRDIPKPLEFRVDRASAPRD